MGGGALIASGAEQCTPEAAPEAMISVLVREPATRFCVNFYGNIDFCAGAAVRGELLPMSRPPGRPKSLTSLLAVHKARL